MRVLGVVALFAGILSALGGLSYTAFVSLRGWTLLTTESIAANDTSTVRVAAKAGRPYWAAVELRGAVRKKPVDHDIAVKVRVVDAANASLRSIDVHVDSRKPLPACVRFVDEAPCAVVMLDGPDRERITMTVQVAPVTATKAGDLTYVIDVSGDARSGVGIDRSTITVFRSSREEAIGGLVVALVGFVLGGLVFRLTRRSGNADPSPR